MNTYSSADDEKPLLFLLHPLRNLGSTLHKRISIRIGLGHTIELKHGSDPCERAR